jgi:phage baseplate assembly protein W
MSGVLTPLRRDRKRDFASGDGEDLLASKVEQLLATEGATARSSGELPWRTAFGTPLQLLRHQNNDAILAELARAYVRDALRKWLPEVRISNLTVARECAIVRVSLRYRARGDESLSRSLAITW